MGGKDGNSQDTKNNGKTFHGDLHRRWSMLKVESPYPTTQFFRGATAAAAFIARPFDQSELEFFGPGEGDGISFSNAAVAVVLGSARSRFQHPIETQIGQAVRPDLLA